MTTVALETKNATQVVTLPQFSYKFVIVICHRFVQLHRGRAGLDNVTSEGASAFDTLENILQTMASLGKFLYNFTIFDI